MDCSIKGIRERQMMKLGYLGLGILLSMTSLSWAQTSPPAVEKPKIETYYINTDDVPTTPSEVNNTPFFTASSTGSEVMEEVESLNERMTKLEGRVRALEEKADVKK